jgi:hypothetical protein
VPHKSVKINLPQIVREAFDDEVVLVNLDSGHYYSLEGIGAEIWRGIEEGLDTGLIAMSIARKYNGDQNEMDAAIEHLLVDLETEKIITLSNVNGDNVTHDNSREAETSGEKPPFQTPVLNRFTDMRELLLLDPIHDVDETGWPRLRERAASGDSSE